MTAVRDPRALVEEARAEHEPAIRNPDLCVLCRETWPCLTVRLATALEQATQERDEADRLLGHAVHTRAEAAQAHTARLCATIEELTTEKIELRKALANQHPALTTPPICGNTGLTPEVEARCRALRANEGGSPEGGCGKQLGWLHAYRCLECGRWLHSECMREHFRQTDDDQRWRDG